MPKLKTRSPLHTVHNLIFHVFGMTGAEVYSVVFRSTLHDDEA